jgi:predicted alpha/beta hydrolase family esterase
MRPPILIIPGHYDSGPGHWQSLWEANLRTASRVQMPNWEYPHRPDWVEALDEAVRRANETAPPLLVAHSLGCLAVALWAASGSRRSVHGALLVAPTDVERPELRELLPGWAPIPLRSLGFEARVVASSDDPFVTLERAKAFAGAWGARFTHAGAKGHLNAASGHGPWALGEALLEELY